MTITNGTVSFTRMLKPADYEKKEVSVSLSFGVEDGADPDKVVAFVGAMARDHVLRMLHLPEDVRAFAAGPADAPAARDTGGVTDSETRKRRQRGPTEVQRQIAADEHAALEAREPGKRGEDPTLPAAITDNALMTAINAARARGVSPDRIKAEVISRYVTTPGASVMTVAQEQRMGLLTELDAMTAGELPL